MRAEAQAVVKVRPVQSFDRVDHCLNHHYADATHVGTVLVGGHRVLLVDLCDSCAQSFTTGMDSYGHAATNTAGFVR